MFAIDDYPFVSPGRALPSRQLEITAGVRISSLYSVLGFSRGLRRSTGTCASRLKERGFVSTSKTGFWFPLRKTDLLPEAHPRCHRDHDQIRSVLPRRKDRRDIRRSMVAADHPRALLWSPVLW